jgi:transposase
LAGAPPIAFVVSLPCLATAPVSFAVPPWTDDDPRRLELAQRLEADHLARRIERAVARLDLTLLWQSYGGTGSLPHRPDLLLRVVLYEVQRGQHSPAAWQRAARECEPVRWLLRGCTPSRTAWYTFRDRVAPWLDELNRQVLHHAVDQGVTPASRGALDGTLVAAQASRHKLVNEATLQQRAEQLTQALHADAAGATTPVLPSPPATSRDAPPAPLARPAWMAPTPTGRQRQQQRLQRAQTRLAQLQQRNADKRAGKRKGREKVVVSTSDPEAALGRDKEGIYRPLYNAQVLDDLDSPLILAYDAFAQPNDAGTLEPMVQRHQQLTGRTLETLLGDTAYAGGDDLAVAAAARLQLYAPLPKDGTKANKQLPKSSFTWLPQEQVYVCPQGQQLHYERTSRQKRSGTQALELRSYRCAPQHCVVCPLQPRCTTCPEKGRTISRSEHEELIEALRARMRTEEAKALYRLRRQTVELVNADWKQHRQLRRFSGRGLKRVRCQVALMVLAHNLITLLSQEAKAAKKKDNRSSVNPAEVTP